MELVELLNSTGGWVTAAIILIYLWKVTRRPALNEALINRLTEDSHVLRELVLILKDQIPRITNILENQTTILIRSEARLDEMLSRLRQAEAER
ncbi:MAG: hypothetical protein QW304_07945 [Thermoproteota archaeon]